MDLDARRDLVLPRRFLRMCRRNLWRRKVADSSGLELSGGGLLTAALALRRLLHRQVLGPDEAYVGVLLPPSVAAVVANAALAIDRRIAVNLNYNLSSELLDASIAQCGIRHVLSSRRLRERLPLKFHAETIDMEDLNGRLTRLDRLRAAAQAWLLPAAVLERRLRLAEIGPDDLVTVLFTSGSTGQPKGVMLSHRNIATNIDAFNRVLRLTPSDVLLGVLPLFHSFGYTATLWTVLSLDPKGVYHYTPLEARQVGRLCRHHGGTILVAAPTFLRSYLRRCEAEDFRTLDMVIVGAEKLPAALADAFQERFGLRPTEGYGMTELSPVVAVNYPLGRHPGGQNLREGTVGRPLEGIAVKVVDPQDRRELPAGEEGLLLVKGPNVMQGYLGRPDLTAAVLADGWYATGDIAAVDAEGFIRIAGRASRFSKIGGEMVPHIRVEELIVEILGGQAGELPAAVAAVPDEQKGERLVVLHCGLGLPAEEVCRRLLAKGLPPLWVPSPDSFRQVRELPLLGSGKLDLSRMRAMALAEFAP